MDTLFDELIRQGLGVLGTALTAVLVALAIKALQRIGISLDAERAAQLEYTARQAVLAVEERAAAYAKAHVTKMLPAEKMRQAIIDVTNRIPNVDDLEARRVIEAVLPQVGAGAAAGLRELGKAIGTR
jgi:hypothetical protein